MNQHNQLGEIITTEQHKDAIHVAVAPVIVGTTMGPGEHACLNRNGLAIRGRTDQCIGVIDPFLRTSVHTGQRCWLFLYPGSITSLRHDWTHPAFPDTPTQVPGPEIPNVHKAAILSICDSLDLGYDALMEATKDWVRSGDYFQVGDREGLVLPDEFWPHFEALTGLVVPPDRKHEFFSCAC